MAPRFKQEVVGVFLMTGVQLLSSNYLVVVESLHQSEDIAAVGSCHEVLQSDFSQVISGTPSVGRVFLQIPSINYFLSTLGHLADITEFIPSFVKHSSTLPVISQGGEGRR